MGVFLKHFAGVELQADELNMQSEAKEGHLSQNIVPVVVGKFFQRFTKAKSKANQSKELVTTTLSNSHTEEMEKLVKTNCDEEAIR
jgi:predicted lactoylglutathione lyase